jgi:hypothetical protein
MKGAIKKESEFRSAIIEEGIQTKKAIPLTTDN